MNKNIGFRLVCTVAITSLLIIGVFAYFNVQTLSSSLLREVERHANQLGETMVSSTRFDMMLNQRDRIQQTILSIGKQAHIRDVRLLNKVGKIIYSSDNSNIGKMVDKNAESCYACHFANEPLEKISITERTRMYQMEPNANRVLGIITPIYNDNSCWTAACHAHPKDQKVLGVLDVSIFLDEVDQTIRRSEWEIGIFACVAIISVGILIGFFVKRWVSNPVNELLSATKQVSMGNLDHAIRDMGEDEIGKLAHSFNDMTKKLSEARLQLFQSDKLASIGRLAAGVAHEINNPLTGVLTYSSFLLKRTNDRMDIQDDLKVIVRETLRCREIVKSLLDFARQSIPKKNHADINEIVKRAVSVVENLLTINTIKVCWEPKPDLPQITIDANQIQQVFINLLVNASDAIGKSGGSIGIEIQQVALSPHGVAQVKKASCPKRHNLIDPEVKIGGLPSIKVKVRADGEENLMHLDPVYGKHDHLYPPEFSLKKDTQFLCPECGSSLVAREAACPGCHSPVLSIAVDGQGAFEICSSKTCDWERWQFVDSGGAREYLEIQVSDTGCGISNENLPKIFDPFFSTKGQAGTGLGLAVIWGIIDNHKGTVTVDSHLGKGTTFTIRLPLTQRG